VLTALQQATNLMVALQLKFDAIESKGQRMNRSVKILNGLSTLCCSQEIVNLNIFDVSLESTAAISSSAVVELHGSSVHVVFIPNITLKRLLNVTPERIPSSALAQQVQCGQ
jgi:hypothetical protein